MSALPSAAAQQSASPTPGQASRFLAQATFGPTPADIEAVVRDGYAAWLDAQLAMPPSQTLSASPSRSTTRETAPTRGRAPAA